MARQRSVRRLALEDQLLVALAANPGSDRFALAVNVGCDWYDQRVYVALRGMEADGRVVVDRSPDRRRHLYSRAHVRAFDSIQEAWEEAP